MKIKIPLITLSAVVAVSMFSCMGQASTKYRTADKKATAETRQLLGRMASLMNHGIMFGHQDDLAYGIGWKYPKGESDVKRVCGDLPAVFGWDLGHIEIGDHVNIDSVPFDEMALHAKYVHKTGGINTFSWHLNNPLTGGSAWDVSSSKVVASILPGGGKHELYKQWLGRIGNFFNNLKDDNGKPIPLIFRPYHELGGKWFWWGDTHCTPKEYKALWQFTFTYLTGNLNVHNLLFAFSQSDNFKSEADFLECYPGDAFVDVVGFDYYMFGNDAIKNFVDPVRKRISILTSIASKHQKIAAFTETGYEKIPDPNWWTAVLWKSISDYKLSYVLAWRNAINRPDHFYAPYPGQKSSDDFKAFYNLKETLFLEDVQKTSK